MQRILDLEVMLKPMRFDEDGSEELEDSWRASACVSCWIKDFTGLP